VILIANRTYGGCEWKAFFTAMNTLLPLDDVLTMHCGANITKKDGRVTLFLGLSGTGKTALSADPDCLLIGDDGHAWDLMASLILREAAMRNYTTSPENGSS